MSYQIEIKECFITKMTFNGVILISQKETVSTFFSWQLSQLWTLANLAYPPWQQGLRESSPQHCCYWHHPCFPRRDGQVPRHPADFAGIDIVDISLGDSFDFDPERTIPGDATKVLQLQWGITQTRTVLSLDYTFPSKMTKPWLNTPLSFWPKCSNKVDLSSVGYLKISGKFITGMPFSTCNALACLSFVGAEGNEEPLILTITSCDPLPGFAGSTEIPYQTSKQSGRNSNFVGNCATVRGVMPSCQAIF